MDILEHKYLILKDINSGSIMSAVLLEEYEEFISKLHQMMKQETYKNDIVQNIRNKQKYMVNKKDVISILVCLA